MKKIIVSGFCVLVALVVSGAFSVQTADASVSSFNVKKQKFVLFDLSNETQTVTYTLPPVSDHHGEIYIFKRIGSGGDFGADVAPTSGESIDLVTDVALPVGLKAYSAFIADENYGTWWFINRGFVD